MKNNKNIQNETQAASKELLGKPTEASTPAIHEAGWLRTSQKSLSKTDFGQLGEAAFEPPQRPGLEHLVAEIQNVSTISPQTAAFEVNPTTKA